jgi:hypothetical protein
MSQAKNGSGHALKGTSWWYSLLVVDELCVSTAGVPVLVDGPGQVWVKS